MRKVSQPKQLGLFHEASPRTIVSGKLFRGSATNFFARRAWKTSELRRGIGLIVLHEEAREYPSDDQPEILSQRPNHESGWDAINLASAESYCSPRGESASELRMVPYPRRKPTREGIQHGHKVRESKNSWEKFMLGMPLETVINFV